MVFRGQRKGTLGTKGLSCSLEDPVFSITPVYVYFSTVAEPNISKKRFTKKGYFTQICTKIQQFCFPETAIYRGYFRRATPTRNALFDFFVVFSQSKKFKFACCLGEFISEPIPEFTKTWSFLSILHTCHAFLKYALQWMFLKLYRLIVYYTCIKMMYFIWWKKFI